MPRMDEKRTYNIGAANVYGNSGDCRSLFRVNGSSDGGLGWCEEDEDA